MGGEVGGTTGGEGSVNLNTENFWQIGHRMYREFPSRMAVRETPGMYS
jgi:hypothetical protein